MAEKEREQQSKARSSPAPRGARSRVVVAVNVVVASLLVIGLLVAANYIAKWLSDRYNLTADLTEGRRYSFSSRTRLLLGRLNQPVRLTSLFYAEPKDETAQTRKRRMEDLLRQYETTSGRIETEFVDPFENAAALQELGRRITLAYTAEPKEGLEKLDKATRESIEQAREYHKTIKDFLAAEKELEALLTAEKERFRDLTSLAGVSQLVKDFSQQVVAATDIYRRSLEKVAGGLNEDFDLGAPGLVAEGQTPQAQAAAAPKPGSLGIPDYAQAKTSISQVAEQLVSLFDDIAQNADKVAQTEGAKLPPGAKEALSGAAARYTKAQQQLAALAKQADALKPLELDRLRGNIALNTVVVEAAGRVRIVGFDDLWPAPAGRSRYDREAPRAFAGEEALTSAIFGLTTSEKPVAMFVKWDGMPISEDMGAFTELAAQVSRSNFIIANWDLMREQKPPKVEGLSQAVLVVLPPDQPNRQMWTPPPGPEAYEPVKKFIDEGGSALVFVPLRMGLMTPPAPYVAMLRDFGLDVHEDAATIFTVSLPDGEKGLNPYLATDRYPSATSSAAAHPIVVPLQGMKSTLFAPVPLVLQMPLPAGVQVWPLIETPATSDCFAKARVADTEQKERTEFNPAQDVAAPYPVAVALTRELAPAAPPAEPGKEPAATPAAPRKKAARLVVFGDLGFASDEMMSDRMGLTSEGVVLLENPANGELVVNSLLWLAGQEDLISVSPQAKQSRRIGEITRSQKTALYAAVWGGLPAAAVIIGIVVYFVRTRKR